VSIDPTRAERTEAGIDPGPSRVREAGGAMAKNQAGPGRTVRTKLYRITVKGRVGERLFDSFTPLQVETAAGETTLTGPIVDQAALQGILSMIQGLGLELLEVKRLR
jgi:hypothetical protein